MTDAVPDELGALRERAYGPSADIHEDPEAMRRLEELEAAQSPSRYERTDAGPREVVGVRPSSPPPIVSSESPDADQTDRSLEPGDDAPTPVAAPPGGVSPRLWRWVPALWIVSILVAFGIGAAATSIWAVTAFAPITRGPAIPHHVAVLSEAPDPAPSGTLGLSGLRSFGDFYGLSILSPSPGTIGPRSSRCLIVMKTADYQDSASDVRGPVNFSCSAGRFPATVVMSVEADAPTELRAIFRTGTALQFVLDGSRVGVFTDR
ncbi:hypothetical protein GCM10023087_14610 [Microbacterium rhizosphaerae]